MAAAPSAQSQIESLNREWLQAEARLTASSNERQKLEGELSTLGIQIANRKKHAPKSDDLGRLLVTAQELSIRLQKLSQTIEALRSAAEGKRRSLIAQTNVLLADKTKAKELADRLVAIRARAMQVTHQAGATQLVVPAVEAGPLDDPADLLEKASKLAGVVEKLKLQETQLQRLADSTERRAALRRAESRVSADPFSDDTPRRKVLVAATRAATDDVNAANEGPNVGNAAPTEPLTNPPVQGTPGVTAFAPTDTFDTTTEADARNFKVSTVRTGRIATIGATVSSAQDPTWVLAGVLDGATLRDLRSAMQSGDPDSTVRALRKAEASVKQLAARLTAKQAALKTRAQQLKGRAQ